MFFTIAIPTYNNENTIARAIQSAIQQDFEYEYEILVVNNASVDSTLKIIEGIKSDKLRVENNDKHVSMFENHNICLKNAKGEYILFCHSDDELLPNSLKILERKIIERSYPFNYVVWGRSFFRDFYKNWEKSGLGLNTILAGESAHIPFFYSGLTPSGTCYNRNALLNEGGFCKTNHKLAPSDVTTMHKLALAGFEFEFIDRILFRRQFASTPGVGTNYSDRIESLVDAFSELSSEIGDEKIKIIAEKSMYLETIPFVFWISILKMGVFKKEIKRRIIRVTLKDPSLLRHNLFRKIIRLSLVG